MAGVVGPPKVRGLSAVIMRPAARETLGFFRGRPCPFNGTDASRSDWKSDMLFGRPCEDMSSQLCSRTERKEGSENWDVECMDREERECLLRGG